MFTVGLTIASFDVSDTVIVSPTFARLERPTLSDSMRTDVNVGAVKSIVTRLESVADDCVTPIFPERSWNATDRLARPSKSELDTVYDPEYVDPLPLTVAGDPASVTAGATMSSLAVIESVMVSPTFARDVSAALSDAIVTEVSVGGVRSIVTTLPSVTDVTVTPALPAKSTNEIAKDTGEPSKAARSAASTLYDAV
jgi:hypothetical protein